MDTLYEYEVTELNVEQKKLFDSVYLTPEKSSYLPEVLLFLPMPLMLGIIYLVSQTAVPRSTITLLWITVFTNAFIFLMVFFKIFSDLPKQRRKIQHGYRILQSEGFLMESSVSSVKRSFYYFEELVGNKIPLINITNREFPFEETGTATIVEEFPGQYALLDFSPSIEILN